MSRDQTSKLRELLNHHNLHDLLISLSLLCQEHKELAKRKKDKLHALEWEHVAVLIERVADEDSVQDLSKKFQKP